MMNAQILTKTLVPSGQNAQSLQGAQPGSNPARAQDTRQDSAAPVTATSSVQEGKTDASDSPNDFKHALTEKMAEPEPEPQQEQGSEESLTESEVPQDATLQMAAAQSQTSAQVVTLPSTSTGQTMPEVSGTAMSSMPDAEQAPPRPTIPMLAPDSGVHEIVSPGASTQASTNVPVVTPEVTATGASTQASTNVPVVVPEVTANSKAVESPAIPLPETSLPQVTAPTETPRLPSTQNSEIMQASQASQTPVGTQTETEPASQATAQPEKDQSILPSPAGLPKATVSESVQTQPRIAESSQSEPVPAAPETKPVPTFEIQSIPEAAPRDIKDQIAPLHPPSIKQARQTDTPAPLRGTPPVTPPTQQADTAMLEPSQAQHASMPENPAPAEIDPSNISAMTAPDTQTTPEATEITLPRSLNPTQNPLPRQIQDSIALGVQQQGRDLVIRLDPPELGRVAMRFQEDSQGITGVLEVQKSQTRHDIQQALPEIVQQLQDSGVQIKRIEVLLSADADAETFEDQAFAQARDQDLEHEQASEQNKARRNPAYGWPASDEEGVHRQAQDQYAADQGINLLI
ncbi:MAG: hypothetical protein GY809_28390 [Planctomycetes bacterium]|nr:hypothetical protein [Planctomycetota bacterium]